MENRHIILVIIICLLTFSFPLGAYSQIAQLNQKRGFELAKQLCVNCHVVGEKTQTKIKDAVPSFQVIANKPGQNLERLAGKIIIPHPLMPTVPLTRSEIRDIVAYIMSLKSER